MHSFDFSLFLCLSLNFVAISSGRCALTSLSPNRFLKHFVRFECSSLLTIGKASMNRSSISVWRWFKGIFTGFWRSAHNNNDRLFPFVCFTPFKNIHLSYLRATAALFALEKAPLYLNFSTICWMCVCLPSSWNLWPCKPFSFEKWTDTNRHSEYIETRWWCISFWTKKINWFGSRRTFWNVLCVYRADERYACVYVKF